MPTTNAAPTFSARQLIASVALVALFGGCTSLPSNTRTGEKPGTPGRQSPQENPQVQSLLGQAYGYLAANDLTRAEETLLRAARIEPLNAWVILNLGVVYQRTGRTDRARDEYRKVLAVEGPRASFARVSDSTWKKTSPEEIARHNLKLMKEEDRPSLARQIVRPMLAENPEPRRMPEVSGDQQSSGVAEKELLSALEAWRTAWAARDINAYLAHYAETFRPLRGNRTEWAAERRRIITTAGSIDLRLETPKIRLTNDNQAIIYFRQHYRTARLSDSGTKKLILQRIGERWCWRVLNRTQMV